MPARCICGFLASLCMNLVVVAGQSTERNYLNSTTTPPTLVATLDSGAGNCVYPVTFSSDGRWFATAQQYRKTHLYILSVPPTLVTFDFTGGGSDNMSIAFSSDSRWFATGSDQVRFYNLSTVPPTLSTSLNNAGHIAFSPDGRWKGFIYNLSTWPPTLVATMNDTVGGDPRVGDFVHSVAFSPDGRWFGTGHERGQAHLYDLTTVPPKLVATLKECSFRITAVAFSSDWFVTACQYDSKLYLYGLSSMPPTFTAGLALPSMPDWVSLSYDWQLLSVAAGLDALLYNFSVLPPAPIASLGDATQTLSATSCSPNGQWFGTGSCEGKARLYSMPRQSQEPGNAIQTGVKPGAADGMELIV